MLWHYQADASTDANTDLISLAESPTDASTSGLLSPISFGSIGKNMTMSNRRDATQRDSFSDLVGVMRAKKPYTPMTPPTPRPSLINDTNGMLCNSDSRFIP
jgi:hypothetical protein